MRQSDASRSYRDADQEGLWVDDLEYKQEMIPGQAYWYVNRTYAPIDIYLMGEVDDRGHYCGEVFLPAPPVTPGAFSVGYSWRVSHPVHVSRLGLLEQGFTGGAIDESDKIVDQVSGDFAYYLAETGQWLPEDFEVQPGHAYWIANLHAGNSWTYEYRP